MSNYKVLGYIKNERDFKTISEWEEIAKTLDRDWETL